MRSNAAASLASLALLSACAATPPAQSAATAPDLEAAAGATTPQLPPGARHRFTVDDMLAFDRISEPSASPDGKHVVFTVATPDVAQNKTYRDVCDRHDRRLGRHVPASPGVVKPDGPPPHEPPRRRHLGALLGRRQERLLRVGPARVESGAGRSRSTAARRRR